MGTHYKGKAREVRALDSYIKLMRAANITATRTSRQLDGEGITESQFAVLEALLHLGPLHQCEIAGKLLMSGANITTILDNLEKRRLITREKDPADRRSIIVGLSLEGKELITSLFPRQAEFITTLMSALDPAEQIELGKLCRKLGLALSKI